MMEHFLEDLVVVDAATFLAGPGAATMLGDFGAKVIKIEPPSGDGYRGLVGRYPVPYHWLLTSRNKESLALDLSKDSGQALLHQVIAKADVMTTNFMRSQLERYQLTYPTLKAINPRLVFGHITGYGDEGPEADRRAFDVTGWWARSGMMEFVRDPDQTPLMPAPGMGDHSTATALFGAIMSGLYKRERTGEGCHVSTSLAANGVWANGMALQGVAAGNDLAEHRQQAGWVNPLSAAYGCADGSYLVLTMINTAREYPQLCAALGHPEWLQDERFSDIRQAMRNRGDLQQMISDAFAQIDYAEAARRLDDEGITYSKVQTMSEVLVDPQLRAAGIVIETGDTQGDYELTISSPINMVGEVKKAPQRAPDIGANSLSVLRELDFAEDYIQSLIGAGIVVDGSK
ncbi:MAG: CoA transferase [Gammaproteobacteria bacterium TMED243]|jgi:formyl-CoA transferase|nr:carnitine dehydratase [Gammaproteobacteria bacterium]RPG31877.1 MAG: CoA transferase [Gammaproteobacteria bacterium TMED243]